MASSDPLRIDPQLLQQAERFCRQRLERDPENGAVLRSLAEIYRKSGKLAEAAEAYGRVFHLDPRDREADYIQAVLSGQQAGSVPGGIHPTPFVLIKNFLPAELHDTLLPFFVSVQNQFISVKHNKEYRPEVRQTLEYPSDWEGSRTFRACLVKSLPAVLPRLYLPPFEVAGYEVQVRAYRDGHFFKIHRDVDPKFPGAHRMINFVYYFHRQPKPYTGGDLLLFDSDIDLTTKNATMSRFTRIVPEDNSIVFFPPHFYHSVVEIRCPGSDFSESRFVINGHVHKKPAAAAAIDGSTDTRVAAVSVPSGR